MLVELGAEIITEKDSFVHVSGHPGQMELKRMYDWIRPEILVPVHGEVRHMVRQAELGKSLGIKNTLVPRNGTLIRLAPGPAKIIEYVAVGRFALDGHFIIPAEDDAIVTRRRILYNGALVVSLVVDAEGEFLAAPEITNLGSPDAGIERFKDVIIEAVFTAADRLTNKQRADKNKLAEAVRIAARKAARNYSFKETGPLTTVTVTQIGKD
jgi:ribonuclease J